MLSCKTASQCKMLPGFRLRVVSCLRTCLLLCWVLVFHENQHHVSLSFLTVTSPLPAPAPPADPPPAPDEDAPAAPGPAPDAAADAAPAPAVPSIVETSPCMKAQGGLLGELSNGQRSPLGQYTSPSP